MENNQKWINLSYVASALLLAYVTFVVATKFSVLFDIEGRIQSLDKILLVASGVIGFGLFFGLNRSSKANGFMNEVVSELGKVTWPTQEETMKATIAVLIAVVIAGFVLWIVDSIWVTAISAIL
jgi:preprotein translocase subunit SecE